MSKTSVVIVNWNVRELLRACLDSLEEHAGSASFEVVVVDNDSEDGSAEMIRRDYPQVQLLANTRNVGFARASNQGASRTTGDLVLFLNPDTELTEDTVQALQDELERHPETGIVGPRLIGSDGVASRGAGGSFPVPRTVLSTATLANRAFPRARWARGIWLSADETTPRRIDWVSGACMLVRREVLDETGGFDEAFFLLCEDIDLCFRAKVAGWDTRFCPTTSVIHHEGSSIGQQDTELLVRQGASLRAYLVARYGRLGGWALSIPLRVSYLARFAISGAAYVLHRSPENAKRFSLVKKHFRMLT